MPLASRCGLTFVELLMAATIFSMLLVGVSGHLRGNVVAWRRTVSITNALQETRIALDQVERDLVHALVFEETGTWTPVPVFTETKLQYYTVVPSPSADASDAGSVRFVTYALDTDHEVTALTKSSQTIQEAHAGLAPFKQPLLSPVASWSVQYGFLPSDASAIQWKPRWDDAPKLPRLVKVTVAFPDASPARRVLQSVVTIPVGIVPTK